ncbi:MAG: Thioredoxin reductase [Caldanaerobacter subterraneus]|uniref:Thioredoxin reductase n=6 Tax=Caldanaerobacter subterraneus TaxID=911092 RepID=Q8R817_CALS4|nr:thioredoxin-disulfide reductase [Caldanaerobacter subterraneus]AAM25372.1 Thioredoxin reductase [Caldanaerobacter subterraneus subsp. tengcongensis MB4]ERM90733.1 thioredoxin reductase [Caldanaerobacter subterraneus subsp. yonseiensis KB-1]KKC29113.1 thioredoxin reductase [Caldanaerobacter subterraneus subsp. pacificus DSM 12653]KUK08519.1 MAG: Thioredoxin reductase [Caldanaerobacter subterraneus]MBE3578834.1 thioredoxin-disulfide reductase [Caldanaerobacter subterraneus]
MYDLIILGGGPAGLTAGLYAARSRLKTVLIEKTYLGGQIVNTYQLENYPGYEEITGADLVAKMEAQVRKHGLEIVLEDVESLDITGEIKRVKTANNKVYEAKAIILAMGATPRKLGVPNEDRFIGAGISFCATCDGAFYRDAVVAVIGGGNTAVEDALYLTKFAKKVYIIHRRDQLRATKIEQEKAFANEKIEFIWNTVVVDVEGEYGVERIRLKNVKTGEESTLNVDGVFVAIGYDPNTELVKGIVELDEYGYIITDDDMKTNIPGVFAAGDIRHKLLRQVITAAGDGATAAYAAEKYIESLKK